MAFQPIRPSTPLRPANRPSISLIGAVLALGLPALRLATAANTPAPLMTMGSTAGVVKQTAVAKGQPVPESPTLVVHADRPGVALNPDLWGVFFEEINHAGDGGLYAEMVRNRDFQEVPTNRISGNQNTGAANEGSGKESAQHRALSLPGWTLHTGGRTQVLLTLDTAHPLNAATPSSLRLDITPASVGSPNDAATGAPVALINDGYWGMNARRGATYQFSVYARCSADFQAPLTVTLQSASGQVYGRAVIEGLTTEWKPFTARLNSNGSDPNARLVLSTPASGSLWLDMVSLFPIDTFKKRPNGMRADLAAQVNALHPAFVRFPGGCFVEGNVLATRFNWKNTLGNIAQRPGHLNDNWNYRSTDGLGYHEYLQWCEDMGATPLFVVNCGMAHHEFVPVDRLRPWVQDAMDALEYANGPVDSKWGALRAKNGHPAPFKLKYLEIGNENGLFGSNFGGDRQQYAARYKVFFDAIKAKYPDVVTIADTRVPHPMELVDDHYYNSPGWFWANIGLYDHYDRRGPKVYVGEYAVTSDCGTGNLKAALAEAAWMTGLERNGDVVKMASYAPLFVNANDRKWNPDAIVFDSAHSYGTPSYHVQKLFSLNRPDTTFPVDVPPLPSPVGRGGIGLDTWLTQAEFKDIEVIQNGKTLYASNFAQGAAEWKAISGNWKLVDGVYRQTEMETDRRAILIAPQLNELQDYTLHLKARKLGGAEGFIVLFRARDANNFYWWNIGGWQNREHGIEKNVNGAHIDLGNHVPGHIDTGRWYDIKVESQGSRVKCYLDDKLVYDFQDRGLPTLAATAGRVEKTGEIIVKLVNGADTARPLTIDLQGIDGLQPTGKATTLTGDKIDGENSLAQPNAIVPTTRTITGIATHFDYTVPAQSVTILRLKGARR